MRVSQGTSAVRHSLFDLRKAMLWAGIVLAGWLPRSGLTGPRISEILNNPPGSPDIPNEYIELRGMPNEVLPEGTYLVSVEGDVSANPGTVQTVFDLSGRRIGGNGFLVLLQKDSPYQVSAGSRVLINEGADGWGSGTDSTIGHQGEKDQTDLENGSQTFFLIHSPTSPVPGDDIDSNNDGTPDGAAHAAWTLHDSVGYIDRTKDKAYGAITFRRNPEGTARLGTVVPVGFNTRYLGRAGNTMGSAASDWIASGKLNGSFTTGLTLGTGEDTEPTNMASAALDHIGAPNFGAPPLPGVTALESDGGTVVTEGTDPDVYTLSLNTTPAGAVTVTLSAEAPLQVSSDNGITFSNTAQLSFNDTTPRSIVVRATTNDVIEPSPRVAAVTHSIVASADPAHYPTGSPMPTVDVQINEGDRLLLSELKVNPPGDQDAPCEYIELRSTPGATIRNTMVLAVGGDAKEDPGVVQAVFSLDEVVAGENGLILFAATNHPYAVPTETLVLTDDRFSVPGGVLGNGSLSLLLIVSTNNVVEGEDLDKGDNGVLEGLPKDAVILDAVGWTDQTGSGLVFGGVQLSQPVGTPDAAARLTGDNTPLSTEAWFNGELAGTGCESVGFHPGTTSPNLPLGAVLTPGTTFHSPPWIAPLPAFSSVIGDPTTPAIPLVFGDADLAPSQLTLTANSDNPSVVPNSGLTIVEATPGERSLLIAPTGVGYATITITVSDGSEFAQTSFDYAASAMGRPGGRFPTGASDASSAVAVGDDLMLVGDDENQVLRLYSRTHSGGPLRTFDINPFLDLVDFYADGRPKEVDIEAATRAGNRVYWIGGHSHGLNAEARTNRSRFFATDIAGEGTNLTIRFVGKYDFLKVDLIEWDENNGHGLGAGYLGLAESASVGHNAKASDGSGFNIEGLCLAPGSTNTAYLAFRAPLMPPTQRLKALIVPVTNLADIVQGNPGPGTARFAPPIQLDLDQRGIRGIEGSGTNYLIIAGPPDAATGVPPKDFRLFTWTGDLGDTPEMRAADLSGMRPEAIVALPPLPWTAESEVQLLSDNGVSVYYGDKLPAKQLPEPGFKKFRGDVVKLGAVVPPAPRILLFEPGPSGVLICWKTTVGQIYRVQQSAHLLPTGWTNATDALVARDSMICQTLALPPTNQSFYRVVLLP